MSVQIVLPLSDKAAQACVRAAEGLGVEPWELAVHALWFRDHYAEFWPPFTKRLADKRTTDQETT